MPPPPYVDQGHSHSEMPLAQGRVCKPHRRRRTELTTDLLTHHMLIPFHRLVRPLSVPRRLDLWVNQPSAFLNDTRKEHIEQAEEDYDARSPAMFADAAYNRR